MHSHASRPQKLFTCSENDTRKACLQNSILEVFYLYVHCAFYSTMSTVTIRRIFLLKLKKYV